jgi:predicted HTH transcriptional regulator
LASFICPAAVCNDAFHDALLGNYLTNASLRERLGVEEKNKAAVSRYIREAVEEGVIKPFEKDAPRNLMKYLPFWA